LKSDHELSTFIKVNKNVNNNMESKMEQVTQKYTYEEVIKSSEEYFKGDEFAASAFVGKYALSYNDEYFERTPDDMHCRLAGKLAEAESKFPNPMPYEEIYGLMKDFKYIVLQGSPSSAIGNPYKIQSSGNCFVIDAPLDSYGGICYTDQQLCQLAKRRGGIGFDISKIRPKGLNVKNAAGTTDGIGIFMERYSNSCREVAQSGRRGALILTISIHHPDILEFIKIKKDKSKVTGANISIRLSDEFMNAVTENKDYELRFPIDSKKPTVSSMVSAKEMWDEIIQAAWESAEPGLLFWDTMIRESIPNMYGKVNRKFYDQSTNPCGEILMGLDSCRLTAINLLSFVKNRFKKDAYFDYEYFKEVSIKAQRIMDDICEIELGLIDEIIEKVKSDPQPDHIKQVEIDVWKNIRETCELGRRTGLGITALGDTLAGLNVKYGSKKSIEITEEIYKTLAISAEKSSCIMAGERGAFPLFDPKIEKGNPLLKRIFEESPEVKKLYKEHGRRNIAITTTAPTGTLSTMTQTTSGIEPVFLTSYTRRKKINPSDKNAVVDFTDAQGDRWQEFEVNHPGVDAWMEATGKTDIEKSPYHGATSAEIDWRKSVDIQAKAQKWVGHSISKTCNLPKEATKEVVADVYMDAWKKGCKGFTVYREGSRDFVMGKKEDTSDNKIEKTDCPKRPKTLTGELFHTRVHGEDYFVIVGLHFGDPYEVFAGKNKAGLHKNVKLVNIKKIKRGKYSLCSTKDGNVIHDDVSKFIGDDQEAITRLVSLALRHGGDVSYIVHSLEKTEGSMQSFGKAVARILKKFIPENYEVSGEECPNCSGALSRIEGCMTCQGCSWTRCA